MPRITAIHERTVPISSDIGNAYINFSSMTLTVVAVVTDVIREGKPVIGYGFNSNGRYGPGWLVRDRLVPRLVNATAADLSTDDGTNLDPTKVWDTMMSNEKPGGHGERAVAVGCVDMAVWDATAKIAGKPLFQLLADQEGRVADPSVFVYAAGGYYQPGKGIPGLLDEMRSYLDRGYSVVKMKIAGAPLAEDIERIEAVLDILGPGQQLAVDANGRLNRDEALAYSAALAQYPLFWYEEPVDPLDYQLHAEVAAHSTLPIATGENLMSFADARNLIRHGGLQPERDWLQFDCALSYGLVEYRRTLEMLRENGWSWTRCIPHGGHQLSLNIAAGLGLGGNESYPDLFQPYGGFPDGVEVIDGHVTLPELPGIGFEAKSDLWAVLKDLA